MKLKKDTLTPRLKALQDPKTNEGILYRVAKQGRSNAQGLVPVKTRNLWRTIRIGEVNEHRALLLAGGQREVGYAAHVEFGTRPHVIVPRNKKVLAWGGPRRLSGTLRTVRGRQANAEFFAMRVNHPGSRAKPYLVPGVKAAMRTAGLRDALVKAWNDAA